MKKGGKIFTGVKTLTFMMLMAVSCMLKAQIHITTEGSVPHITQAQLTAMGLDNHDATMPFIRLGANDYWIYLSEGGPSDGKHSNIKRIRTTSTTINTASAQEVPISGIPNANINSYNGWKAWLMNLHQIAGNEYLGVLHLEDQDQTPNPNKEEFKMGLAYSNNGGASFSFLGFVLEVEMPRTSIKSGLTTAPINIAGAGLTWDDTYFYIYFSDMAQLNRSDRHLAVARASKSTVITNARNGLNTAWKKYYNGAWNEPGLGGGRSSSLGTMLEYHTTIMYNTYLNKWLLFDTRAGYISMRSSENPFDFNVPRQDVYPIPTGVNITYISINPEQQDMTKCGKEFSIFYRRREGAGSPFDTHRLKIVLNKTLKAGDIAVYGANFTSGNRSVRFVNLAKIEKGTELYLSDYGWNGATEAFYPQSLANSSEGLYKWTVAADIPAGTLLKLSFSSTGNPSNFSLQNLTAGTFLTAQVQKIKGHTAQATFVEDGDNFFIYQVADNDPNNGNAPILNPLFICGYSNLSSPNTTNTNVNPNTGWADASSNVTIGYAMVSWLPGTTGTQGGLINGTSAVGMTGNLRKPTSVAYNGPITATTASGWASRINNKNNWLENSVGTINSGSLLNITSTSQLAAQSKSEKANVLIKSADKENIIYPNPVSSGLVTVNVTGSFPLKYQLYNLSGQLYTEGVITENNKHIDTGNLVTGSYVLKLDNGTSHILIKK